MAEQPLDLNVLDAQINVSSVVPESTAMTIVTRLVRAGIVHTKESSKARAERIASGQCSLLAGWCLTHNEEDTMAHHFRANPGAFND